MFESLLQNVSPALAGPPTPTKAESELLRAQGDLGTELWGLLSMRNGFYGGGSALLVRPLATVDAPLGLGAWNDPTLWTCEYDFDLGGALFFAEDLFGTQFALRDGAVWTFDIETGAIEELAASLSEWAALLTADDGPLLTGEKVGREWEARHGPLAPGKRLRAAIPFVIGGSYELSALRPTAESGIGFVADIANQIKNLPNGARIRLRMRE